MPVAVPVADVQLDLREAVFRGDYVRYRDETGAEREGIVLDAAAPGEATRLRHIYRWPNGKPGLEGADHIAPTVLDHLVEYLPNAVPVGRMLDTIDPLTRAYRDTMGMDDARKDAEGSVLAAVEYATKPDSPVRFYADHADRTLPDGLLELDITEGTVNSLRESGGLAAVMASEDLREKHADDLDAIIQARAQSVGAVWMEDGWERDANRFLKDGIAVSGQGEASRSGANLVSWGYHLRLPDGRAEYVEDRFGLPPKALVSSLKGRLALMQSQMAAESIQAKEKYPERLSAASDPEQEAWERLRRVTEAMPGQMDALFARIRESAGKLDPVNEQARTNLYRDYQQSLDEIFGIIREGPDRGADRHILDLEKAGITEIYQTPDVQRYGEVSEQQGARASDFRRVLDEQWKAQLRERGKAILEEINTEAVAHYESGFGEWRASRGAIANAMEVAAVYWRHGIFVSPQSQQVRNILDDIEQKNLPRLLALIGHNSGNLASQEVFSRITGAHLGKTQKERVAQLEAWAGPQKVAEMQQQAQDRERQAQEQAQQETAERAHRTLRDAYQNLGGLAITVSDDDGGQRTVNGKEYIALKASQGMDHVDTRKQGAAKTYRLVDNEEGRNSSVKSREFTEFCKAVIAVQPDGDVRKAMEAVNIAMPGKEMAEPRNDEPDVSQGDTSASLPVSPADEAPSNDAAESSIAETPVAAQDDIRELLATAIANGASLGDLAGALRSSGVNAIMLSDDINQFFHMPVPADTMLLSDAADRHEDAVPMIRLPENMSIVAWKADLDDYLALALQAAEALQEAEALRAAEAEALQERPEDAVWLDPSPDAQSAMDTGLIEHLRERASIRDGEHPGWSGLSDSVENASTFVRQHAMRHPEQAEQWAAELRGNPFAYGEAAGLESDNIRGIATLMEQSVKRMEQPQVGDLVHFEPGNPGSLMSPYSGRVIAVLDTSGGDFRYHLRTEVGPDTGMEATVYGKDGRFRLIDVDQAYGFDRNAPKPAESPEQTNDASVSDPIVIDGEPMETAAFLEERPATKRQDAGRTIPFAKKDLARGRLMRSLEGLQSASAFIREHSRSYNSDMVQAVMDGAKSIRRDDILGTREERLAWLKENEHDVGQTLLVNALYNLIPASAASMPDMATRGNNRNSPDAIAFRAMAYMAVVEEIGKRLDALPVEMTQQHWKSWLINPYSEIRVQPGMVESGEGMVETRNMINGNSQLISYNSGGYGKAMAAEIEQHGAEAIRDLLASWPGLTPGALVMGSGLYGKGRTCSQDLLQAVMRELDERPSPDVPAVWERVTGEPSAMSRSSVYPLAEALMDRFASEDNKTEIYWRNVSEGLLSPYQHASTYRHVIMSRAAKQPEIMDYFLEHKLLPVVCNYGYDAAVPAVKEARETKPQSETIPNGELWNDRKKSPDAPYGDIARNMAPGTTDPSPRNGRDITDEEFVRDTGFSVQYGNYVNNKERQALLNMAYDGLYDMAAVLDVPVQALAVRKDGVPLGLALGARGSGRAMAHYEPGADTHVINLTKTKGAGGAMIHEWLHAVDATMGKQVLQGLSPALHRYASHFGGNALNDFVRFAKLPPESVMDQSEVVGNMADKTARMTELWRDRLLGQWVTPKLQESFASRLKEYLEHPHIKPEIKAALGDKPVADYLPLIRARIENIAQATAEGIATGSSRRALVAFNDAVQFWSDLGRGGWTYDEGSEVNNKAAFLKMDPSLNEEQARVVGTVFIERFFDIARGAFKPVQRYASECHQMSMKSDFYGEAAMMDAGRKTPYWSSPHELLARAGSAVFYDKSREMGIHNDFLDVYSAPESFSGPEFKGNPNPEGAERLALKAHFEQQTLPALRSFLMANLQQEMAPPEADRKKVAGSDISL